MFFWCQIFQVQYCWLYLDCRYESVRCYDSDDHQYHRNVFVTGVIGNEDINLLITIVLLACVFVGFTYFSSRPLFNEM